MLKKLLLGLLTLAVLFCGIGLLLPAHKHVERSAVYAAKPDAVFVYLNGFKRFNEWSPWAEIDPNTKYQWLGAPAGKTSQQNWDSKDPNAGTGTQTIIESQPYHKIRTQLTFGGWDGVSYGTWEISPEGSGTRITWGMDSDLGKNPMNRWFGLFMDKMIGKDFDKGLANLKPKLEALPTAAIAGIDIDVVQTPAQPYLYISGSASLAEAASALGQAYASVGAVMQAAGLKQAGAPLAVTQAFDDKTGFWKFDAGIPIASDFTPPANSAVKLGHTHAGYALKATHIGPYQAMPASYGMLLAYKAVAKLEEDGAAWEEYISDPGNTPQDKLITHIYWPVK